jgi:hypothetical protein
MAKAVRDGTGYIGDPNLRSFDAGLRGIVPEPLRFTPENLQGRVVDLGLPGLPADEYPDLVRHLVGQAVIAKGGGEADDTSRDPLGGLSETVVFGPVSCDQGIQAPSCAFQGTLLVEVGEVPGVNTQINEVAGTKNPLGFDEVHDPGGFGGMTRHSESIG